MTTIRFLFLFLLTTCQVAAQDWSVTTPAKKITQLTYREYNTVHIQLEEADVWSQVTFQSDEAEIQKSAHRGEIRIFPIQPIVKLHLYVQGNLVQTLRFKTSMPTLHISIKAAPQNVLYRQWQNKFQISVLTDSPTATIRFQSDQLTIIDSLANELILIPKQQKNPKEGSTEAVLHIFDGEQQIATKFFVIKDIDFQMKKALFNGQEVDLLNGIDLSSPITGVATLSIQLSPEDHFNTIFSDTIRIEKLTITLARGNRAIQTMICTCNQININNLFLKARPGDRLVIELQEITVRHQHQDLRLYPSTVHVIYFNE